MARQHLRQASAALAIAGWLLGGEALPAGACDVTGFETGTVASVIDGETLKLADGRTVRLIGAKAPMPPLGWRGDDPWPLVDEARTELEALALGKPVELGFGGSRSDRHEHLLAQVFVVGGGARLWLQQEMVTKGLARVYSFADNRACAAELLIAEREARASPPRRLGHFRLSRRLRARPGAPGTARQHLPAGRG